MNSKEDFPQIKRDLIDKINAIEKQNIADSVQREQIKYLLDKLTVAIYGDKMAYPQIDGMDARLKKLEAVEDTRIFARKEMVKIAVGSMTLAIGGAVIWVFNVITDAFRRGGH